MVATALQYYDLQNPKEELIRHSENLTYKIVDGDTLDKVKITESIAYEMGIMIGKMHNDLKDLAIINRYSYDESLLTALITETNKALKQENFSEKQAKVITDALSFMRNHFVSLKHKFMLVHSDLSHTNLLYHGNKIIPIDFSMAGYCIPEIELAMVFGNINDELLNKNVFEGYKSVCHIELDYKGIDSCSCLLILLFAVGQHERFAKEEWFTTKLNEWCDNKFIPLVEDKNALRDMNNSDLIPARLWKDVL